LANLTLIWDNKSDIATLSGGSWSQTLPLDNIKNRQIQKTARSTSLAQLDTQFDIDFGSNKALFQSIIICNHNLTLSAKYRIIISDDASFTTSVYDSGFVNVFDSVFSNENLNWEDNNFWFGQILQDDLNGYKLNIIHLLNSSYFNQYIRVEFDDTFNSNGYVDIGRLIVAPVQALDINMEYGSNIGWIDRSLVSEAIGGAEYFDNRAKKRIISFTVGSMQKVEAMERMFELQRRKGISGEVFVIPNSDDVTNIFRESFLGRILALTPITHQLINRFKTAFKIQELL